MRNKVLGVMKRVRQVETPDGIEHLTFAKARYKEELVVVTLRLIFLSLFCIGWKVIFKYNSC